MGVIGGLVAIGLAVWYYRTAEAKGGPALQWAIAGVIVYYVPNFLWKWMIADKAIQTLQKQPTPLKSSVWGILIGVLVAVLVWTFFLKNANFTDQSQE
jgi:hypothetical protein